MSEMNYYWNQSKEALGKSEDELEEYIKIARAEGEKYNHIEMKASLALENVRYQKRFFSNDPNEEILKSENMKVLLRDYSGTALYTYGSITSARKELVETSRKNDEFFDKFDVSLVSSTGSYVFNDIVSEVRKNSPSSTFKKYKPIENEQLPREEIFERLLCEIKKMDDGLANLLNYSEKSIEDKEDGWIGNTVNHSVEMIDRFFRINAPNNQIKTQDWFVPNKDSSSGITRKHRVEFFLRKRINQTDKKIIKDIDYWGDQISSSVKKLQKVKHTSNEKDNKKQVIEKIDYSRLVLLNIILYRA